MGICQSKATDVSPQSQSTKPQSASSIFSPVPGQQSEMLSPRPTSASTRSNASLLSPHAKSRDEIINRFRKEETITELLTSLQEFANTLLQSNSPIKERNGLYTLDVNVKKSAIEHKYQHVISDWFQKHWLGELETLKEANLEELKAFYRKLKAKFNEFNIPLEPNDIDSEQKRTLTEYPSYAAQAVMNTIDTLKPQKNRRASMSAFTRTLTWC